MKKNNKILTITIVSVLILALLGFLAWNLWNAKTPAVSIEALNQNKNTGANDGMPLPPAMSAAEIQSNPYLPSSLAILNQISAHTDERGFYGGGQDCSLNNTTGQYDCQVQTMDYLNNGQQYASHRESQSVIWARYRYFEKTGDLAQKQKLQDDINNVVNNVLNSDIWTMQSQRYNCLLMEAVANSQYLSQDIKNKARRICNDVEFETYPDSIVATDQHQHIPFKFWDSSGLKPWMVDPETVVVENEGYQTPQDKIVTYQADSLVNDISKLVNDYAFVNNLNVPSNVTLENKKAFIKRELLATIDQIAAIRLNEKIDPTLAQQNLIDYLLLTKETLEWYANDPLAYTALESCLMKENLNYFITTYAPDTPSDVRDAYLNYKFPNVVKGQETMYCEVAALYLNNKEIDNATAMQQVQESNQSYNLNDWKIGYAIPTLSTTFVIDFNAILSGILAK